MVEYAERLGPAWEL